MARCDKSSVPCGAVALLSLILVVPASFPKLAPKKQHRGSVGSKISRLDFVGFLLLLSASVFLVTALEEAGTHYRWSSPLVIIFLILSSFAWLGSAGWSLSLDRREIPAVEPVFTWRFVQNRVFVGALLYVETSR